jgi:hypothetical protein
MLAFTQKHIGYLSTTHSRVPLALRHLSDKLFDWSLKPCGCDESSLSVGRTISLNQPEHEVFGLGSLESAACSSTTHRFKRSTMQHFVHHRQNDLNESYRNILAAIIAG